MRVVVGFVLVVTGPEREDKEFEDEEEEEDVRNNVLTASVKVSVSMFLFGSALTSRAAAIAFSNGTGRVFFTFSGLTVCKIGALHVRFHFKRFVFTVALRLLRCWCLSLNVNTFFGELFGFGELFTRFGELLACAKTDCCCGRCWSTSFGLLLVMRVLFRVLWYLLDFCLLMLLFAFSFSKIC